MITQIIEGHRNHDKTVALLYIIVVCLLYVLSACVSSFLEIIDVRVDTSTGILTLKRLLSKTVILCKDIEGYYSTSYTTRLNKEFNGMILKMNNNKSYRLRQQNLKSIPILTDYLSNKNVKYLGEKNAKFQGN